jgi:hypothetical protein
MRGKWISIGRPLCARAFTVSVASSYAARVDIRARIALLRQNDQDLERIIERDALEARGTRYAKNRPTHVGHNCPVTSGS